MVFGPFNHTLLSFDTSLYVCQQLHACSITYHPIHHAAKIHWRLYKTKSSSHNSLCGLHAALQKRIETHLHAVTAVTERNPKTKLIWNPNSGPLSKADFIKSSLQHFYIFLGIQTQNKSHEHKCTLNFCQILILYNWLFITCRIQKNIPDEVYVNQSTAIFNKCSSAYIHFQSFCF